MSTDDPTGEATDGTTNSTGDGPRDRRPGRRMTWRGGRRIDEPPPADDHPELVWTDEEDGEADGTPTVDQADEAPAEDSVAAVVDAASEPESEDTTEPTEAVEADLPPDPPAVDIAVDGATSAPSTEASSARAEDRPPTETPTTTPVPEPAPEEEPTEEPAEKPPEAAPAPAPRVGRVRFRLERRVRAVFTLAVVLAIALVAAGTIAFRQVLDAREQLVDRADPDLLEARDRLDTTSLRLLLILAATALVVAAMAALLYRLMRRNVQAPLQQLSHDAQQIAAGDLRHPVEPVGPVELQELAVAMEQMRQRIVDELAAVTEARDALERQTGDLARSNAELEQFAYVASHDLQEPLRKVASFCQLLQSRYGGQLDERADQYIAFAVDGAKRMQALINDLLALSRVGRTPADAVVVRAGQLVDAALENLSEDIESTGAEITVVGPLPRVRVETSLGVALFQNLVSNSLKFRRPGTAPSVHISARRSAGFHEFRVSDEGIGIAPEYAERIFVIFQRLHGRDDFGGTGIGLALCRKIVEGHGGRIWVDTGGRADGRPDERPDEVTGTTIRFTLPVVEGDA